MGNPYPVALRDTSDVERFSGAATFTDPANQPGGGGSQPFAWVSKTIHYNDANILTGITVYTPAVNEEVVGGVGYVSIPTAWNGSTPTLKCGVSGALDWILSNSDMTQVDGPQGQLHVYGNSPMLLVSTDPVVVIVDDGSGGSPGASQGVATIWLAIKAAP